MSAKTIPCRPGQRIPTNLALLVEHGCDLRRRWAPQAQQLLGGNWDPYPIDMSFQPPCMVLSHIGLAQPGKINRVRPSLPCTRPSTLPPAPPAHLGAVSRTSCQQLPRRRPVLRRYCFTAQTQRITTRGDAT